MLMTHSSPSIASPASQHPSNHSFSLPSGPPLFVALPHQALVWNWPPRNHPPHTPFTHFVRSNNLKPCLPAGFRDRYCTHARRNPKGVQAHPQKFAKFTNFANVSGFKIQDSGDKFLNPSPRMLRFWMSVRAWVQELLPRILNQPMVYIESHTSRRGIL